MLPTKSPQAGSNARRGTQSFASTFDLDCWPQTLKILETAAAGWGTGSSQMVIPSLAVVVAASRRDLQAAGNFEKRIQAEVYLNPELRS